MKDKVPKALKYWFVVHFIIDMIVAVPLMFFPNASLEFLGWESVDPILSRIVAAAFFAIGIESLLGRNSDPSAFKNMLELKIIWSLAAIIGLAWSLIDGGNGRPVILWGFLITFVAFNGLWTYWRIRIGRIISRSVQAS